MIVTDNPDLLLEKWSQRDRGLLNTCNGMGYIKAFLHSRQSVRVYYNGKFHSSEGIGRDPSALDLVGLSLDFRFGGCTSGGAELGTRLRYSDVQELTSVIIVVDSRRTTDLNIGQLADYVAMVGLGSGTRGCGFRRGTFYPKSVWETRPATPRAEPLGSVVPP